MKTKNTNILTQNKDIASVALGSALILAIPSGILTGETNWTLSDFVIMGSILLGVGLLLVLAFRKITNTNHRMAVIAAIIIAFLLLFIELAVGIFNSPISGS